MVPIMLIEKNLWKQNLLPGTVARSCNPATGGLGCRTVLGSSPVTDWTQNTHTQTGELLKRSERESWTKHSDQALTVINNAHDLNTTLSPPPLLSIVILVFFFLFLNLKFTKIRWRKVFKIYYAKVTFFHFFYLL